VRFTEVAPTLAGEIEASLIQMARPDLGKQIGELEIVSRCGCGDSFCNSFYVGPPPKGAWGPDYDCVPVSMERGMVVLDVVEGQIQHVEVLDREELTKPLSGVPRAPRPQDR